MSPGPATLLASVPVQASAVMAVGVALFAAGLLGRRVLPAGMGAGLMVSAGVGLVAILCSLDTSDPAWPTRFGHCLTGLALLCYGIWVLWPRRLARETQEASETIVVLLSAAGLAAVALARALLDDDLLDPRSLRGAKLDAIAIAGIALSSAVRRRGLLTSLIALAAPTAVAVRILDGVLTPTLSASVTLLAVAAAALIAVLAVILWGWWRRRAIWWGAPQRPLDSPPARPAFGLIVSAVCALVGPVGLALRASPLTPISLILAAFAALVAGHVRMAPRGGELGMVLVAAAVACVFPAWGWPGAYGLLCGTALAGGHMLWLARFWDQQLLEGAAWTTAGRLIPVARTNAQLAALIALSLAAGLVLSATREAVSAWAMAVCALLSVVFGLMLVRDSLGTGGMSSAGAACAAFAAAAVPTRALLTQFVDQRVDLLTAAAACGVLLAARLSLRPGPAPLPPVYSACIAGTLPAAVLYSLALRPIGAEQALAAALTAAAIGIHLGPWRRAPNSARPA